MKNNPKYAKEIFVSAEYLSKNNKIYAYVKVAEATNAEGFIDGKKLKTVSNRAEPYDFKLHIFELEPEALENGKTFSVTLSRRRKVSAFFEDFDSKITINVTYDEEKLYSVEDVRFRSDRGLNFSEITDSQSADGYSWACKTYLTPDERPVRVYVLTVDPQKCNIVTGTPYGKDTFVEGEIETVMAEAQNVSKRGEKVLAATNADFFDMFGNCKPSGLCVSRGKIVANGESERFFFGVTKDGKPVIATKDEISPNELSEAVGGKDLILKNGKVYDVAPLEGFGEICHPRTAVGICADGKVVIVVVDGRRPELSNGASLCELAKLMREHGAVNALNLDGGGSSTFIVEKDGQLTMLNHPADLARPTEDLIRPLYDSLIVTVKQ